MAGIGTQNFGKEFKILKDRVITLIQVLTVGYVNRRDIERNQKGYRKTDVLKEQWKSFSNSDSWHNKEPRTNL